MASTHSRISVQWKVAAATVAVVFAAGACAPAIEGTRRDDKRKVEAPLANLDAAIHQLGSRDGNKRLKAVFWIRQTAMNGNDTTSAAPELIKAFNLASNDVEREDILDTLYVSLDKTGLSAGTEAEFRMLLDTTDSVSLKQHLACVLTKNYVISGRWNSIQKLLEHNDESVRHQVLAELRSQMGRSDDNQILSLASGALSTESLYSLRAAAAELLAELALHTKDIQVRNDAISKLIDCLDNPAMKNVRGYALYALKVLRANEMRLEPQHKERIREMLTNKGKYITEEDARFMTAVGIELGNWL